MPLPTIQLPECGAIVNGTDQGAFQKNAAEPGIKAHGAKKVPGDLLRPY